MAVQASSARRRAASAYGSAHSYPVALGQLAAVQRDRLAAGGQPGVAAGVAGCFQGVAERLQVGAGQGRVEAVAAGGVEDPHRRGQARRGAEHLPGLAQREVALPGGAAGVGPGPQGLADRFAAGAVGVHGQERQQLAGLAQPGADLAAGGGDLQGAEHADLDRRARGSGAGAVPGCARAGAAGGSAVQQPGRVRGPRGRSGGAAALAPAGRVRPGRPRRRARGPGPAAR